MAYDEFFFGQNAYLYGRWSSAFTRWRNAANKAYAGTYTIDDLFESLREQFVENWDTWNQVMGLPMRRQPPTISIRAPHNTLSGEDDWAVVRGRLTGISITQSRLWRLGPAPMPPAVDYFEYDQYTASVMGDFDGAVHVTLNANAPLTPSGPGPDVYQGFLAAQFKGVPSPEVICSVVVVALP